MKRLLPPFLILSISLFTGSVYGAFNDYYLHGPSLAGVYRAPDTFGIAPAYEFTYLNWVGLWGTIGYRHSFFIKEEYYRRGFKNESHFPAPYLECGLWPDSYSVLKRRSKTAGFRFGAGVTFVYHPDIPVANAHLFFGVPIYIDGSILEPYLRYVIISSRDAFKKSMLESGLQYRFVIMKGKAGFVGL